MTMVALIKKNDGGAVLTYTGGYPTSPGEFFDKNFYYCIISSPQTGMRPTVISKPGPSRPHDATILIDDETKTYCEEKNWPIAGAVEYQEFPEWRGTYTTSNVKEPDPKYITWEVI